MMKFEFDRSIASLQRTPAVLDALLIGVPEDWLRADEGKDTWSPYQVIGHLIHNERTDWLPRIKIILSDRADKTFEPFDRFAHLAFDSSIAIGQLLHQFKELRNNSLNEIRALEISSSMLSKTGIHPALGTVNLKELLAAWTIHDLGHIGQITRVMAKQYKGEIGPWKEYLSVLHR